MLNKFNEESACVHSLNQNPYIKVPLPKKKYNTEERISELMKIVILILPEGIYNDPLKTDILMWSFMIIL